MKKNQSQRIVTWTTALALAALTIAPATAPATEMDGKMKMKKHTLLLKSATESRDLSTFTIPIFEGKRGGEIVWYVVTDSSNKEDAERRGVHYAPKMANAKGSNAVEKADLIDGIIHFKGSVNFVPERTVHPGPTGFPPKEAKPGAIAEPLYTPLIELPDGTILNAPHIKNSTGEHDRLVSVDLKKKTATFRMTQGFFEGKVVHYVSFNASDPAVAALEAVTYTPRLAATPSKGSNAPNSALTGIAPFVNGQTGKANRARQGLSSALLGEGDPFNVLQQIPAGERALLYSPMWDAHLSVWKTEAVTAKMNPAVTDFNQVMELAVKGSITGPDGAPWGAIGVVINCPVVSIDE